MILYADPAFLDGTELNIVRAVRRSISAGSLVSGTKLPEEILAEQFGTTRAKVRIALQQLAFEGLVVQKRNRGAFVASAVAREVHDVFAARQVIERATTEVVTRTITTRQIGELREILASWERDWELGCRETTIGGISQFHRTLASLAHNEFLSIALEQLILRTALIMGLYGTAHGFSAPPSRYRALVDCIESGDSHAASRLMDRSLQQMLSDLDLRNDARSDQEHSFAVQFLQP